MALLLPPHLVYYSAMVSNPTTLTGGSKRFQRILDTCNLSYDQGLNYQQEIGLRHTYAKKKTRPTGWLPHGWHAVHDCLYLPDHSHY